MGLVAVLKLPVFFLKNQVYEVRECREGLGQEKDTGESESLQRKEGRKGRREGGKERRRGEGKGGRKGREGRYKWI